MSNVNAVRVHELATESDAESELFSGVQKHDGLSNGPQLAAFCPPEFWASDNPWSCYAEAHIGHRANTTNWEFREGAGDELGTFQLHVNQSYCFDGIMRGTNMPRMSQRAVGGWMVCRMLKRVPEIMTLA